MEKKYMIMAVVLVLLLLSLFGGESDYEKAQKSFGERLETGNFEDMSDLEYEAAGDFFEWVEEQ